MELENEIIYGPVRSRRFGWDLGINLLPPGLKLCTFDCVYCQYGVTPPLFNTRFHFPTPAEIVQAWDHKLRLYQAQNHPIFHSTISGNGEPTMHPHFPEVVADLLRYRNAYQPEVKLAVLTNGYRLMNPQIRNAIAMLDEPVVKLDCGLPETLARVDRPLVPFHLTELIESIRLCPNVILQTMFVSGWNTGPRDIAAWVDAIRRIRPREVQLYTLERKPALTSAHPLPDPELLRLAKIASYETGVPVIAYLSSR